MTREKEKSSRLGSKPSFNLLRGFLLANNKRQFEPKEDESRAKFKLETRVYTILCLRIVSKHRDGF